VATAEQIKSLIKSHFGDDSERFITIALQVAAHEAQQGHGELAHKIRLIVDKARQDKRSAVILKFPQDLRGLVVLETSTAPLTALIVPRALRIRIERVIHEHHQQEKLKSHGLSHRRKILLTGPPGTGKTMSARVLAHELRLPLYTIQVDKLVTKFMGETSAKLRQIFDLIQEKVGVYLFDEFDAIGGERTLETDVGEMRRVLNSFLQFIEQDTSDSLIVAASNSPKLLDRALYRRFDDVLHYDRPAADDRKRLLQNVLGPFLPRKLSLASIIRASSGLSHAEIDQLCRDAIKHAILSDRQTVTAQLLLQMVKERRAAHQGRQR
jgi:AAA+ superfamily predicted ATPase